MTSKLVINNNHLEKLIKAGKNPQGPIGNNPINLARNLGSSITFSDIRLDRKRVLEIAANNSVEDFFVAVMAWGGNARKHNKLKEVKEETCRRISHVKGKGYSRKKLYETFHDPKIPFIGPAYFTKLVYFMMAHEKSQPLGYIMDQWTAKSINLLYGCNIIHITDGGWVTPDNNSDVYEEYCSLVDNLSIACKDSDPAETETRLFSERTKKDGRGEWRQHVIDLWPKFHEEQKMVKR